MTSFGIRVMELFKTYILDVHIPNVLVGIGASIEVPLITTVGRSVNATHSQIADFVLLSALCRTALDIPFGVIVEYVGVRNVMLSCLLINVFAALLGTRISDFHTLGIYAALSGISLGGFFLSRHIFVAGISSKRYRGLLMSFLSGLLRWAHVIGPLLTGLIASRTGDTRNAFYIAAVASFLAFVSIVMAMCWSTYKQQCAQSCTTSCRTSQSGTPSNSDIDVGVDEQEKTLPPRASAAAAAATPTAMSGSLADPRTQPHIIGGEGRPLVPPLTGVDGGGHVHTHTCCEEDRIGGVSSAPPGLGPDEEHYFHPSALWYTMVDFWAVIWRLGIYIILFGALRSNRKLMLMFAAMEESMSDAQVSYLLSFSFIFDAMLFPLGGIIMDFMGRQFAMAPVTIGLGLCFLALPLCHTPVQLYIVSALFGVADAMGCGLLMTLTADRAPKVYGAPFFGIMRTLADLGHVVGAGGVSFLVQAVGHANTCFVLAALGLVTAVWGVFGVPRDSEPLETPRLTEAVARHKRRARGPRGGNTGSARSDSGGLALPLAADERPLLSADAASTQRPGRHAPYATYGATV